MIQVQYILLNHIYKLFQEYSTLDSPDLSPGSSSWDNNRTNRTQSFRGKYESALFWVPAIQNDTDFTTIWCYKGIGLYDSYIEMDQTSV